MRLRRILAVWAAKITEKICIRIFHRQGATWAGKIALKICPDILHELAGQVTHSVFAVCGTNGKTTVNNLLCAAIEAEGYRVVCNRTGSNMQNGVAAAFALGAGIDGNLNADYACIEMDEMAARKIFRHFKPDVMVLTNLFRDQLDRYGEIDITMNILNRVIRSAPQMKVVVNGDDPLSASIALDNKNVHAIYGISGQVMTEEEDPHEIREGRFCRRCGKRLRYHFYHYSQLGDYYCPECGFQRPPIQFDAGNVELDNGKGIAFTIDGRRIRASLRGFYNVYNVLAVYTALRTCGMNMEQFEKVIENFAPENGRMEEFRIRNTRVVLNLAKNPTGFNQNIHVMMQDEAMKDLVIVINDHQQDGTDISWLWDVEFERLKETDTGKILVSGIRCRDLMLRMKYAGICSELEPDAGQAIRRCIDQGCGNLYVLVNYTALFIVRNMLKKYK